MTEDFGPGPMGTHVAPKPVPIKRERFAAITTGASFGAVVTLVVVLAGAAASLFTKGIRSHFLLWEMPAEESTIGAVIFWLFAIVAVLLLFVNQYQTFAKTRREDSTLKDSISSLNDAVRRLNTLPNENFLPAFQDSFREALALSLIALNDDDIPVAEVDEAIRGVLVALAETAKDFDGAKKDVVYSANVMLFRDRNSSPFSTSAFHLVKVGSSHEEYKGSLELIESLSTTTKSRGTIDPNTKPICLPIPEDGDDYYDSAAKHTKSTLFPGAPTSYVKHTFDSFASIEDFLNKLHQHTSIDRRIVGRVQDYFVSGPGKHIASFATLPIFGPKVPSVEGQAQNLADSGSVDEPLGVLSIHSSQPGMLADNGATLFAPLAGPFVCLVAILLNHRRGLLEKTGPPSDGQSGDAAERQTS